MRFRDYLGTPYRDRGRSLEVGRGSPGVDCYGLVQAFYARELGLELPTYEGAYASAAEVAEVDRAIRGGLGAWRRVTTPEPGDVVLLWVTDPRFPTHVGVYAPGAKMLHVRGESAARRRTGAGVGATLEDLRHGLWARRVVAYLRHESRFPTWRLHALPLPWSLKPTDLEVPVGTTLAEALERAGLVRAPGGAVRATLGLREVPERAVWNGAEVDVFRHLKPHAGDLVVVRSLPQDPVTLTAFLVAASSALSTIGTAIGTAGFALAAALPGGAALAGAVGGAVGGLTFGLPIGAAFLIEGAAVFLTGAAIAGATFAATSALSGLGSPAEPARAGAIGPGSSPTANGVGNELPNDYRVIPSGFGRFKAYPPLGAPPFTEILQGERFWRMLVVVGKGRYRLRDPETGRPRIYLAGTPIDELEGCRYEIREGGVVTDPNAGDPWADRYAAEVLEDGPNATRPAHYWRLGDAPASSSAADAAGAAPLAANAVTFGTAALVSNETDTAATFNGTTSRLAAGSALAGAAFAWEAWAAPSLFDASKRCLVCAGRTGSASNANASGVALYQVGRDLVLEARTVARRTFGSGAPEYGIAGRTYTNALPAAGAAHVALEVTTEAAGEDVRARFRLTVNGAPLAEHLVGYDDDGGSKGGPAFGPPSTRPIPGAGSGPRFPTVYGTPYYVPPRDQFSVGAAQNTAAAWVAASHYAGVLDEVALYAGRLPIEEVRAHYDLGSGAAESAGDATRGARFSLYADSVYDLQVNETLEPAPPEEPSGTRSAPIVRPLGGTAATELGVDLEFPVGLFRVNEDGSEKDAEVAVELRFRRADDPDGWRAAPDVAGFVRNIRRGVGYTLKSSENGTLVVLKGSVREPFLVSFRWPVEAGAYFGSVARVESDGGDNRGGDDTSGFGSTFRVLTMRAVELGSPPLRLEGLCTVGLFLPLDSVGSIVGRVSVEAERMLRIYDPGDPDADGAGWTPYRVTRNAADAALAILTDGDITPEPLADDEVDRDAFLDLRSRAEDFDLYVDFGSNVKDLADLALASSFASLDDAGDGTIAVVEDRPGLEPQALIAPDNARNFRGVKRFPELPHALRVSFKNEAGDDDELVVYDDGFSERGEEPGKPETVGTVAAERYESVTVRGLVNRERVRRYYRKRIVGNRLRSEEWTCEVWLEHVAFKRGTPVEFTHPTALVGDKWARVVDVERDGSGDVVAITVDQAWTFDAAVDYGIRVHMVDEDANAIAWAVANVVNPGAVTTRRLELEAPLEEPYPARGDHVAIGVRGEETFAALVREIRPRDDMAADVLLMPYAPELHDAPDGPVPFDPPVTRPLPRPDREGPPVPRIASVESDERWLLRTPSGLVTRARVRVVSNLSAFAAPAAIRARARAVIDGARLPSFGPWVEGAWHDVAGGVAFVEGLVDGRVYEFEAQTQTRLGLTSLWSYPVRHRVVGKTSRPPAVPELRLEGDRLRWSYPFAEVLDLAGFEVRYRIGNAHPLAWQGARKAHDGLIGGTEFAVAELPRGFGLTVYVVAFDLLNQAAVAPATLLLEQGDAPANVLREIDEAADGWPGEKVGGAVSGGALVAHLVVATQTGTATLDVDGLVATVTGFDVELVRVGDFFYYDADGVEAASRVRAIDAGANALELVDAYEGASSSGACTVEPSAWGQDDAAPAWDGDDAVAAWGQRSAELVYTARTYRPDPVIETGRELTVKVEHAPATAQLELDYRELGPGPAWGPDDSAPAWGPDDLAPAWGADNGWSAWRPWPGRLLPLRAPYEFRARVLEDRKAATELSAFSIRVDVDDREVRLDDVVIGTAGARLPLPEPFREVKGVRWTLQKVPGDTATGLAVVDKRNDGPLVETIPNGAVGTFDFVVEGY